MGFSSTTRKQRAQWAYTGQKGAAAGVVFALRAISPQKNTAPLWPRGILRVMAMRPSSRKIGQNKGVAMSCVDFCRATPAACRSARFPSAARPRHLIPAQTPPKQIPRATHRQSAGRQGSPLAAAPRCRARRRAPRTRQRPWARPCRAARKVAERAAGRYCGAERGSSSEECCPKIRAARLRMGQQRARGARLQARFWRFPAGGA